MKILPLRTLDKLKHCAKLQRVKIGNNGKYLNSDKNK